MDALVKVQRLQLKCSRRFPSAAAFRLVRCSVSHLVQQTRQPQSQLGLGSGWRSSVNFQLSSLRVTDDCQSVFSRVPHTLQAEHTRSAVSAVAWRFLRDDASR